MTDAFFNKTDQVYRDFDLKTDTFDRAGRVHDWRNHVPEIVKSVWGNLAAFDRALVAIVAEQAADSEEWE